MYSSVVCHNEGSNLFQYHLSILNHLVHDKLHNNTVNILKAVILLEV